MIPLHALETDRLRLVPWRDELVDALWAMHANPTVARYLDVKGRVYDRAKAVERVDGWRREYADHGIGKFAIERKADGAFIGRAGFSPYEGEPEIGYSLAEDHWGQGYASEIALGLRDWFFTNRPDSYFIGFAHVDNAASLRVLEKIGMIKTHQGSLADMPHQFYILRRGPSA
ncbi:GNAT family N-acetyltransferase [Devosia sp.]|uniref:GNAT family N-acetyltransferase n=1 Tax=Devosia sp. TaxID=1871048 RepID=UPI001ACDB397|nr:GNAT family N-acetyltransferase [Devosia sp.]MBN9333490.1 GNAT family N-acetyltransferase [Devosia sp.]